MDGIGGEDLEVSVLFKLLPVTADLLEVRYDPHASAPIQGIVRDLGLEGEGFNESEVEVLHFHQFLKILESILEGYLSLSSNITQISRHQGLILTQIQGILVSEFKSLMKLDFGDNIGCNDGELKDVGEVLSELDRIHTLNRAASQLSQSAECVNVALITYDGDDTHRDTLALSELSESLIEGFGLRLLFSILYLIEGAKTNVCEAIST